MNYRLAKIFPNESIGNDGTRIIDIDLVDPISRLFFNYNIAIGAGDRLDHIAAAFSKIELVDGSDVLFSIDGLQMHAIPFFLEGLQPSDAHDPKQSTTNYGKLIYDFGRYLWDEKYAFNPTKFRNPQLRVTWNVDTVEANATALELEIYAYIFDKKTISPMGWLMTKEQMSYSPDATTWKYINLPLDYDYRALFIQAHASLVGVATILDQLRLSEDNDKAIPFDTSVHDLVGLNDWQYGKVFDYTAGVLGVAAYPGYVSPNYGTAVVVSADVMANITGITHGDGGYYLVTNANGDTVYSMIHAGSCPQGLLSPPLVQLQDPEDLYPVAGIGDLELQLKGGATPGDELVHIITQQLRTY